MTKLKDILTESVLDKLDEGGISKLFNKIVRPDHPSNHPSYEPIHAKIAEISKHVKTMEEEIPPNPNNSSGSVSNRKYHAASVHYDNLMNGRDGILVHHAALNANNPNATPTNKFEHELRSHIVDMNSDPTYHKSTHWKKFAKDNNLNPDIHKLFFGANANQSGGNGSKNQNKNSPSRSGLKNHLASSSSIGARLFSKII